MSIILKTLPSLLWNVPQQAKARLSVISSWFKPRLARPGPPTGWKLLPPLMQPAESATAANVTYLESPSVVSWQEAIWFAVPKQRVTRHKKRLKTTVQKRIPLRRDIVTDPRTGETTLRHKMPLNWRDYLPKMD